MVLLSVHVSAEKAAPLRIARLPIIVQSSFNLSAETVAELEKPMISAEEYIRNVNGI